MSVTIFYQPTSKKYPNFHGGTSDDLRVIEKTFHGEISADNINALRALSSITQNPFWDEVADTVEKVGTIKVWGEW
jgi:hypothetical protein